MRITSSLKAKSGEDAKGNIRKNNTLSKKSCPSSTHDRGKLSEDAPSAHWSGSRVIHVNRGFFT